MVKFKIKGLISVIAAACVMSAYVPSSVSADNVSVTIDGYTATSVTCTYNNESYINNAAMDYVTWTKEKDVNDTVLHVYSKKMADYTLFSGDVIVVGYTFDIQHAGVYQLDLSASDVANIYLSGYGVSIDDTEYKTVSAATSTVTDNADSELLKNYSTNQKYYLSQGTHSFKVRMRDLPAAGSKYQYECYVNTITFNKTSDAYVPDIYVYGRDTYTSKSDGLTAMISSDTENGIQTGSCILLRTPEGVFDDGGYYITYPFTVPETGSYNITDVAASINNNSINWLSKFAVSVDDGEYTKVVDMKRSETEYSPASTFLRHMTVNKRYALTAGTHYLNLYLYNAREQGNAYVFLDYIRFTRDSGSADGKFFVYGTDDSSNNIASLTGDYAANTIVYLNYNDSYNPKDEGTVYEGKNFSVLGPNTAEEFPGDGIKIDYSFYCSTTGWYSLDLLMHKNNTYFSPVEISIDSGDAAKLSNSDTNHIKSSEDIDINRRIYDTDLTYFLEEGMHTFSYKLTETASSRGRALSFFTYAEFTPLAESEYETTLMIYGSDVYSEKTDGLNIVSSVNEAGSVEVTKLYSSADDFKKMGYMDIVYPFNVYFGGKYDLTIAANALDSIYVSQYTVGADGEISDVLNNITAVGDHRGGSSLMKVYNTGISYQLTPGVHYLTFRIMRERWDAATESFNKGAYAFLDYIQLDLEDIPQLSLEIADEYVEKGGSTVASVTARSSNSGEVIAPEFDSVVYTSSDTAVAEVNSQTGQITAVGPGKASITADITSTDGTQQTVSADVKVTVNYLYCEFDGFYANGQRLEGVSDGTYSLSAKLNVYNNDLFDGKAALVFAVYDAGILQQVKIVSNEAIIGYDTTPITAEFEDILTLSASSELSAMVWNDMSGLSPIAKKFSL